MASYPTDLRYTEQHEWVRPDGKFVLLGITEAAVARLGTITFVELPYPGELLKTGELVGRVSGESASAAIRMPFTSHINAVNQALDGGPGQINDDPYGAGWILRMEPGNPAAVEGLLDAAAYEALVSAAGV